MPVQVVPGHARRLTVPAPGRAQCFALQPVRTPDAWPAGVLFPAPPRFAAVAGWRVASCAGPACACWRLAAIAPGHPVQRGHRCRRAPSGPRAVGRLHVLLAHIAGLNFAGLIANAGHAEPCFAGPVHSQPPADAPMIATGWRGWRYNRAPGPCSVPAVTGFFPEQWRFVLIWWLECSARPTGAPVHPSARHAWHALFAARARPWPRWAVWQQPTTRAAPDTAA